MRTGKGNQEDEEYDEDDFSSKKEVPSSTSTANNNNSNSKDAKINDKANAVRSKHSVTEQRRRSKINERFQILRDLIPHSDQKRDTASFLLEVIEYVQYLQERVQKYEGSYQSWSGEPTKLVPWRNSHWRVQSFIGQPQAVRNGSSPVSTLPGKSDENSIPVSHPMITGAQNLEDSKLNRNVVRQADIVNKIMPLAMPLQANMPPTTVRSDNMLAQPLHGPASDVQSTDCLLTTDTLSQQEDMTIEGGTISISSIYSEGLLSTLTQALQSAGVDLSQANISIQIDLGKRANRGLTSAPSVFKDHENPASSNQATMHLRDIGNGEDSDQATKRLKT